MGGQRFYFAYGSNLHPAVMADWCQGAEPLGPGRLDDFRLAFTRRSARWRAGAADVVEAQGASVWGAVYAISADLEALDVKEFATGGSGYRRRDVEVGGRPAVTYEVIDKAPAELPPRRSYVELLLEGARAHRLPPEWLDHLRRVRDDFAVDGAHLDSHLDAAEPEEALRTVLGGRLAVARDGDRLELTLPSPPRPDQLALLADLGWVADGRAFTRGPLRLELRPVAPERP